MNPIVVVHIILAAVLVMVQANLNATLLHEVCSESITKGLNTFESIRAESFVLVLSTFMSFCHNSVFASLSKFETSRESLTYDRLEGRRQTDIGRNVLAIIQVETFEEQFSALRHILVSTKIIFVMDKHSEDNMLKLTFFFPHSLIIVPKLGKIMTFFRPKLYTDQIEMLSSESVGQFGLVQANYHGHSIRAVGFRFSPFSIPDYENQVDHAGFELMIAFTILESLNLKVTVHPTSDGDRWGQEKPKGSGNHTGLQGDLQKGIAEIGWANLFITEDRKTLMDFTDWYLVDPTCILMKRRSPKSGIEMLISPFDWDVWILATISLLVVFLFYLIHYKLMPKIASSYSHLLMYGICVPLRESDPFSHKKQSASLRMLNYFFLLCSLVVSASYSGSLVSFLSINVYPSMPQSYDEVAAQVVEKDLKVAVCCDIMQETLKHSKQESLQTLYKRSYVARGWKVGWWSAVRGTDIYIYAKNTMEIDRRNFADRVDYDSMFVMKECFLPLNIGIGLKQQSPIKEAINMRLKQLKEAGIVSKYIQEGLDMTAKINLESIKSAEVKDRAALDFDDTQGIFQLLLIVLALALVAFASEVLIGCLTKSAYRRESKYKLKKIKTIWKHENLSNKNKNKKSIERRLYRHYRRPSLLLSNERRRRASVISSNGS